MSVQGIWEEGFKKLMLTGQFFLSTLKHVVGGGGGYGILIFFLKFTKDMYNEEITYEWKLDSTLGFCKLTPNTFYFFRPSH